MSSRCSRIDGGAYRRFKTMVSLNCKQGKDRARAKQRPDRKRKKVKVSG